MDKINSMYFQLEMDRPLNLNDVNLISPGQYTAKFHDGNETSFDFSVSEKCLNSGDNALIDVWLHDIDYEMNDRDNIRHLTADDVRNGSFDFSEFFIHVDEDHDIIPKKISYLEFIPDDGKVIEASKELIESANRILDTERCEKLLLRECPGHENRYSTFIAVNVSLEKVADSIIKNGMLDRLSGGFYDKDNDCCTFTIEKGVPEYAALISRDLGPKATVVGFTDWEYYDLRVYRDGREAEYGKDFSVSYSMQPFDDENFDDENYVTVEPFEMCIGKNKLPVDLSVGMVEKAEFETVIKKIMNQPSHANDIKKMLAGKNAER